MLNLTKKEEEAIHIVKRNFETFIGPVRVERAIDSCNLYNIYYPAENPEPFTLCYSIDAVRGFLWGCVAGIEDPRFREIRMKELEAEC